MSQTRTFAPKKAHDQRCVRRVTPLLKISAGSRRRGTRVRGTQYAGTWNLLRSYLFLARLPPRSDWQAPGVPAVGSAAGAALKEESCAVRSSYPRTAYLTYPRTDVVRNPV
jgi:hypothetical protein